MDTDSIALPPPGAQVPEFAALTDEEINILHRIVARADQKTGEFGITLFAAYDETTVQEKLSDEQSSKFFRFVLRMVAGRAVGQTPYDRLEQVLRENGIEISPTGVDPDVAYDLTRGDNDESETKTGFTHTNGNGHHDVEEEIEGAHLNGQNGHVPGIIGNGHGLAEQSLQIERPANGVGAPPRRRRASDTFTQPRSQSQDFETRRPVEELHRGRITGRSISDSYDTRHRRYLSEDSISVLRQNEQIHGSIEDHSSAGGYSADESEYTRSRRLGIPHYPNAYGFIPPPDQNTDNQYPPRQTVPMFLVSRPDSSVAPSETSVTNSELLDMADAFRHTKSLIALRSLLWQWRNVAIDAQREHDRMEQKAETHDRSVLLWNAFGEWRAKYQEKISVRRFDEHLTTLDNMAAEHRRIHLLKKAFIHWANVAEDVQIRTATARRHMLRRKYYNAWKEHTLANEQKVKLFILKKFFKKIKRKYNWTWAAEQKAIVIYEDNLVERICCSWLWAMREQQAIWWLPVRKSIRAIQKWRDMTHQLRAMEAQAEQMYNHRLQNKVLTKWAAIPPKSQELETTANDFRYRKLLTRHFEAWRTAAILHPKEKQVVQLVNRHTLQKALAVLNHRAQLERQATQVHQARILRNCFTNWNDRLRAKCLEERIASRMQAEAFYKWVLATRTKVAVEKRDVKIGTKWFRHMVDKVQTKSAALDRALQAFEGSRRQKLRQITLSKLRSAAHLRLHQNAQAVTFRFHALAAPVMSKMQDQMANFELMDRKADAARFFILTTNTFKTLQEATQQHQKIRRRENYAYMRRKVKVGMAREMLRRMQDRLAHIRAMERAAEEKLEDRDMRVVVSGLNSLRNNARRKLELERQATTFYQNKVLHIAFSKLHIRHEELRRLNQEAVAFAAGSQAVLAIDCLRAFERRLIQQRGKEHIAQARHEKNGERHVKNMLRYWAERATASRQNRMEQDIEHFSTPEDDQDYHDEENGGVDEQPQQMDHTPPPAPGLQTWTGYDPAALTLGPLDLDLNFYPEGITGDDVNDNYMSAAARGYLKTPSKKDTAKSRAREKLVYQPPPQFPQPQAGSAAPWTNLKQREPPASAPARGPTTSLRGGPPFGSGKITPFERKLRAQGIENPGGASSKSKKVGTKGRRLIGGGRTPGRALAFAGFEDIIEDERSHR
ncbi:Sfi1-domain-containing protein [Tothia fuscella]|uniref:Sfi1-domain-containing protein n=1 Tax=Tothia fuscella TaxID=1048955 RepID=A0A9P4P2J4_9PEZI|nr:Sfi1-domain-containing protein [Tothia fuscella]